MARSGRGRSQRAASRTSGRRGRRAGRWCRRHVPGHRPGRQGTRRPRRDAHRTRRCGLGAHRQAWRRLQSCGADLRGRGPRAAVAAARPGRWSGPPPPGSVGRLVTTVRAGRRATRAGGRGARGRGTTSTASRRTPGVGRAVGPLARRVQKDRSPRWGWRSRRWLGLLWVSGVGRGRPRSRRGGGHASSGGGRSRRLGRGGLRR